MSGAAAAASNRPTMFSAFISLDGVTFGGGGTAGFSLRQKQAKTKVTLTVCLQVFIYELQSK